MSRRVFSDPQGFFRHRLLSWALKQTTLKRTSNDGANNGKAMVNFSLPAGFCPQFQMFVNFWHFLAEKWEGRQSSFSYLWPYFQISGLSKPYLRMGSWRVVLSYYTTCTVNNHFPGVQPQNPPLPHCGRTIQSGLSLEITVPDIY